MGQGLIENVYRLQIMNATETEQRYSLKVQGIDGARIVADPQLSELSVRAADSRWIPVRVQVPPQAATAGSHPISFVIATVQAPLDEVTEKSVFLVPR